MQKLSPAKINKIAGKLKLSWDYLQIILQMKESFKLSDFLRDNGNVANVLIMLKLDDQWNIEEFFKHLAETMPGIMERDNEFIMKCFLAFEYFPAAIIGSTVTTKVVEVEKNTALSTADKPENTDLDPVKLLKGRIKLADMLTACDGDPQKLLDLLEEGHKQCGSITKFFKAIGVPATYFSTYKKRLNVMVDAPPTTKTSEKDSSSDKTKKPKTDDGPFADLQAKASSEKVKKALGHGMAKNLRLVFQALGGSEDKVKAAFEEAYANGDSPAHIIASLESKYSKGEFIFKFDPLSLKKIAGLFDVSKTFRRGRSSKSSSSQAGSENDGIGAELASKLTDKIIDETQVANLALLAEEHNVDSIEDLFKKISNNLSNAAEATKILIKKEILPTGSTYIAFMKLKTDLGV